jgi:hypothetical protein
MARELGPTKPYGDDEAGWAAGAPMPTGLMSAQIVGEQKITSEESALVGEAYARLLSWQGACRVVHDWSRKGRRIAMLEDPDQDPVGTPYEQRTLQVQTLKSTINHSVADQMDNRPEAKMIPERPELTRVADDLTDVVRYVMDENDIEGQWRRLVEDQFITGTCVAQILWDPVMRGGKGDIAVLRWPVEALVWDPAAEDVQDGRALIKVSWHPLSWYNAHYPDAAEYVGAEPYSRNEVGAPDAWTDALPGDEPRARLLEYWYRKFDAKKKRFSIHVAYMAGGALLYCSERSKKNGLYAHGKYPFVFNVFNRIEGAPVGYGMVQELAPMQRYVNRYYHYFDKNMREASHTRIMVAEHSGVDMQALADWNRDVITARSIDEGSLHLINTPLFTGAAPQIAGQLQADMKQDSGQNQFNRGETGGGVTAASAISALQEAGGKVSRMRTTQFQGFFKEIVEQTIWLIAQYYDQEHTLLLTGASGHARMTRTDARAIYGVDVPMKGELPPPPYNVQIQINRLNPMRVQAQNDTLLQTAQMCMQAGQVVPFTVLFEMLNLDGKDRVRELVQITDQTTQMIQQLQGQLQQSMQMNEQLSTAVTNLQGQVREGGAAAMGAGQQAQQSQQSGSQMGGPMGGQTGSFTGTPM